MKVYNIDETCSILKLKAPVLRKYSALLEDAGYTGIERNSSNARFYSEENIRILRELISYKESGFMTLNDAAKSMAERINGIDVIEDIALPNVEHIAQRVDVENLQNAVFTLTDYIQKSEERHEKDIADVMNELRHVRDELQEMKATHTKINRIEEVSAAAARPEKDERMDDILKELQYTRKELRDLRESKMEQLSENMVSEDKNKGFFSRLFGK